MYTSHRRILPLCEGDVGSHVIISEGWKNFHEISVPRWGDQTPHTLFLKQEQSSVATEMRCQWSRQRLRQATNRLPPPPHLVVSREMFGCLVNVQTNMPETSKSSEIHRIAPRRTLEQN